jgi:hypothetical protein
MANQDHDTNQESAVAGSAGTRPIAKFTGSGGLSAAVWKHKTDGGAEHYSIRMDRTFKNDGGDYESTPYLREGDVLRAQKLLGQVDDWIEQDRAKNRGGQERAAAAR